MSKIPSDGMPTGSVNSKKVKNQTKEEIQQTNNEVSHKETDLRKDPAQVLGKSQVQKSKIKIDPKNFDPKTLENIAGDLEILNKNPKLVLGSDKLFDRIYSDKKKNYLDAANLQMGFVEEFK